MLQSKLALYLILSIHVDSKIADISHGRYRCFFHSVISIRYDRRADHQSGSVLTRIMFCGPLCLLLLKCGYFNMVVEKAFSELFSHFSEQSYRIRLRRKSFLVVTLWKTRSAWLTIGCINSCFGSTPHRRLCRWCRHENLTRLKRWSSQVRPRFRPLPCTPLTGMCLLVWHYHV